MYPSVIPENDLVPHGNQNQLPCFARHGPQQIQTLYYRVMAWPAFSLGMTYPFGGEPVISLQPQLLCFVRHGRQQIDGQLLALG